MPTKEEIHEEAKKRFKEILDFESAERQAMQDDKEFGLGQDDKQWDGDDLASRKDSGRSYLTIMRSNQFTDHVKNQQRQNKASIKISATDEGAQEEIATRRQGLIRHIQYESKAGQARQAGFDDAVDEGRGHWLVDTEFVEGTFNKKIVVKPIKEARSVYMSIRRERPDYSDCKWGFIVKAVPRDEFEEKSPDKTLDNWDGAENFWYTEKDVMVADYYVEEYKTRKLVEVEIDGATRVMWKDEIKDTDLKTLNIINEREEEDPSWHWYKMTGSGIIDDEDLPWKEIPIITCIGKEDMIEGRWICKGLLRDVKAPLRMYNFISSNEADIIAKAPRAPWVGVEGQFEGYEQQYANSNTSDVPYLQYKDVPLKGGGVAPAPQRAQYSVDLHNITQQKLSILEDIRAITGLSLANLGEKSNETSGVAIKARAAQGDASNYHFIDNFSMAIGHEGRVINSALNVIYDTQRTVTIMGEDDEEELLGINGKDDIGLGKGNFNVTVSVGPNFNTQREEQAAGMLEMLSNAPLLQQGALDLVIRSQDWVGKDALADRAANIIDMTYNNLTKMKNLKDEKNGELAVLQQQLQQAQQQAQQMQMQMQQLQQALEKSKADQNQAKVLDQQNKMKQLEIEQQRVQLEAQKIKGELELKSKELEGKLIITEMDTSKDVHINEQRMQVELIKNESQEQKELRLQAEQSQIEEQKVKVLEYDAETKRLAAEQSGKEQSEGEKLKEAPKTTVNVLTPKKKKSVITGPKGVKYNVETEEV